MNNNIINRQMEIYGNRIVSDAISYFINNPRTNLENGLQIYDARFLSDFASNAGKAFSALDIIKQAWQSRLVRGLFFVSAIRYLDKLGMNCGQKIKCPAIGTFVLTAINYPNLRHNSSTTGLTAARWR